MFGYLFFLLLLLESTDVCLWLGITLEAGALWGEEGEKGGEKGERRTGSGVVLNIDLEVPGFVWP